MKIQISIQNPQKAIALLEFLKTFEMIDTFKVIDDSKVSALGSKKEISFFDRFYGKTKSGFSIEQIDNQLNTLRKEWQRDI